MTLSIAILASLTAGSTSQSASVTSADALVGKQAETSTALDMSDLVRERQCKSSRMAVVFYRARVWDWQRLREAARLADRTPIVRGKSCKWARYAASEHRARADGARRAYYAWKKRLSDPVTAICLVFKSYCSQAIAVASCESHLSPYAVNGQYLGAFQMGSSERRLYGHGDTVYEQAKAAHAYFVASGSDWSPWSCKP